MQLNDRMGDNKLSEELQDLKIGIKECNKLISARSLLSSGLLQDLKIGIKECNKVLNPGTIRTVAIAGLEDRN